MQKIGIITKPNRKNIGPTLKNIISFLEKNNKQPLIEDKIIADNKINLKGYGLKEIVSSSDMLIALGGDGTFLHTARLVAKENAIPILGVNIGSLGFLTETTESDLHSMLKNIFNGKYTLDKRIMLEISATPKKSSFKNLIAFNEIVIAKDNSHRIINIVVNVDRKYVNTFKADGLIISTPTGSTAYSLSAGGPLVSPNLDVLIITPICSHTLNNRSIVIPANSKIEISLDDNSEKASINLDGQISMPFSEKDIITIKKSLICVNLIKSDNKDYYNLWRTKLSWGKRG